jgi:DNA-binding NarL/FixJ family response regulator
LEVVQTSPDQCHPILDLVLVDMESIRGSEAVFRKWCGSETKVVVIAERCFIGDVRVAMEAGANGFLLTRLSSTALILSLRLALNGQRVFPTELVSSIYSKEFTRTIYGDVFKTVSTYSLPQDDDGGAVYLKAPYRSVLRLVGMGFENQAIADSLDMPHGLVKLLLSNFMKSTGIRNRTQAAVWAVRNGLTNDGPEAIGGSGPPHWTDRTKNGSHAVWRAA